MGVDSEDIEAVLIIAAVLEIGSIDVATKDVSAVEESASVVIVDFLEV